MRTENVEEEGQWQHHDAEGLPWRFYSLRPPSPFCSRRVSTIAPFIPTILISNHFVLVRFIFDYSPMGVFPFSPIDEGKIKTRY